MHKPNFYEDYDSFIKRVGDTRENNKSFRDTRLAYFKDGITDYPFLLRTENQISKISATYSLEIEQELDEIYNDIALYISLNGTSAAWDILIDNSGLNDILTQMYSEVGIFINERYSNRYGIDPIEPDLLTAFMVGVLLGRIQNGNSRSSSGLFKSQTVKDIQGIINRSNTQEEAIEGILNKKNLPRAKGIAHTEVGIAQSASEMHTMRNVATTKAVYKYWVGVLDDRIRDSHLEATQFYNASNAIPLESYFIVNGNQMLHPRDYNVDPKEVINCRCYVGYIVII